MQKGTIFFVARCLIFLKYVIYQSRYFRCESAKFAKNNYPFSITLDKIHRLYGH